MIQLTRLNGCRLDVNCDLIKYAEASPDTVLTLVTGEKLVVLESCDEVSSRALLYRASILRVAWPEASPALTAKSVFDAHKIALPVRTAALTSNPRNLSWISQASVESC